MTKLFDSQGKTVVLGRFIAEGGEGKIFAIDGAFDWVAKIYKPPIDPQLPSKLRAMIAQRYTDPFYSVSAWPSTTLHEKPNGPVCGLVMRRVVNHKDIHVVYGPAHRKVTFPKADWKFLLYVAMNTAAAFDVIHQNGVIIGDVNQSNVLVSEDSRVRLIDCDSYQFCANGQLFLCGVGVDRYTPPELQGRALRGITRSTNHDNFGLALLIFHLLFMGRHPFDGIFQGKGEMGTETAIKEYRFAYGRASASYQIVPPPHTLALSDASPVIADLFERAFAATSFNARARPSASDWYAALKRISGSLRSCGPYYSHVFSSHLSSCPWCALMQKGAIDFFLLPLASASSFNIGKLWAQIEQVPCPTNTYAILQAPERATPTSWPAALRAALPTQPAVPRILVSPPAFPALVFQTQAAVPSILVSPPAFRSLVLPPPKFQPATVPVEFLQKSIGIAAVTFVALLPVLTLLGGILGAFKIGNPWLNASVIGIGLLTGSTLFGIWWILLELGRRNEEREQYNEEREQYEEELAERKALQEQHLERCKKRLKEQQEEARKRYDEEMRQWQIAIHPYQKEAKLRREASRIAKDNLQNAEQQWVSASTNAINQFDHKKTELQQLKGHYSDIEAKRSIEWQQLQAKAPEIQKADYLSRQLIDPEPLPDIGPARKATLRSFGIETASDVEISSILRVPGFGPKRANTLMAWRDQVEATFLFNAAVGVPKHAQQAFESKYQQVRQPIQKQLLDGEYDLKKIARDAEDRFRQLLDEITACTNALSKAQADSTVIPSGI